MDIMLSLIHLYKKTLNQLIEISVRCGVRTHEAEASRS